MADRLFGIETEYGLVATDARGTRINQTQALDALMRRARRELRHLPDELSRGMFLENGSRFYVDCGGHPEVTTPECSNPWDVVRYVRAGESILLGLATEGTVFFRCNVDYSGTQATWGSHESYMYAAPPSHLARQIVPHLVSRLVYTGAGGFRNVSPGVEFTLSPRTAHICTERSRDSTGNRGIFHDKDEDLCGGRYHRLHVLCGESLCSELATWLRMGTTALIVAMCDAGLHPGDGVALEAPVAAMQRFAGDPTCRAVVATADGRARTAVEIQRHYLAQAEAHAGDSFMPPWAGEVCRQWRAVLDRLDGGWEAVATTLDWAIKLVLYRDRVRRWGLAWESLGAWNVVAGRLAAAWARARQPEGLLAAATVLKSGSPVAAEVKGMTPLMRELALDWADLDRFLRARAELFEIDTRYGQLGDRGIFAALDAAGALTHRVPGVDDVARAVTHPPDVPRARCRGALVRQLAGNDGRYVCDWEAVFDTRDGACIDLSDPFAAAPTWERESVDPLDAPEAATGGDPIAMNQAALEHRKHHRLAEAEQLLRRAIEIEDAQVPSDSPKRPHRRNNLAVVLLRAGRLVEARDVNAEAWRLKLGPHDLTSGRILSVRLALDLLLGTPDVELPLGQLKTLLVPGPLECRGGIMAIWDIPDVLEMLAARLPAGDARLLTALVEVLNDYAQLPRLDRCDRWVSASPLSLRIPWPDARRE